MDGPNKKREIKARDKSLAHDQGSKRKSGTAKVPGTVNFTFDPNRKKHSGDKKTPAGKKAGDKRPFKAGGHGSSDKKKVYSNRDGKPEGSKDATKGGSRDQTHSQHRREKQKVSELIKKLRINYNKLLMKKKELKQTDENKYQIVKESIDIIGDKFKDLIYKHDGCRIMQALIKHGSKDQKIHVIENLKEHIVQLMSQKYSHHLAQKAYFFAPLPA
jgi:hypothetical protein